MHRSRRVEGADDALTTAVIIQADVGYIQREQTQQPKHVAKRLAMGLWVVLFIFVPGVNLLRVRPNVNPKLLVLFQVVAHSQHPFVGWRGIILPA